LDFDAAPLKPRQSRLEGSIFAFFLTKKVVRAAGVEPASFAV
jgi:hypothetical protein